MGEPLVWNLIGQRLLLRELRHAEPLSIRSASVSVGGRIPPQSDRHIRTWQAWSLDHLTMAHVL